MTMVAGGEAGVPTLSQIIGWDTEHLDVAATDWVVTADRWEAAQQRALSDLVVVRGLSDALREASAVARRGADQIGYLKRYAVQAISAASDAGFDVNEDLSVTDVTRRASRINEPVSTPRPSPSGLMPSRRLTTTSRPGSRRPQPP